MAGEHTELDRTVIDRIGDPLMHMVRNAADHGIESPEERRRTGKPETGTIALRAYHQGGSVHIDGQLSGSGALRTPGKARLLAAFALGLIWLGGLALNQLHWTEPAGDKLRATLVQGNIPQELKWQAEQQRTTLERYADRMARALASIINVIDPHVIVLGGGLSSIRYVYQRVPELWARYVFSDRVDTPLRRHVHGDSSGVRGAAWLWPSERPSTGSA